MIKRQIFTIIIGDLTIWINHIFIIWLWTVISSFRLPIYLTFWARKNGFKLVFSFFYWCLSNVRLFLLTTFRFIIFNNIFSIVFALTEISNKSFNMILSRIIYLIVHFNETFLLVDSMILLHSGTENMLNDFGKFKTFCRNCKNEGNNSKTKTQHSSKIT